MGRLLQFLILMALLVLFRQFSGSIPPQAPTGPNPGSVTTSSPETVEVRVRRAVDGDTLLLESGERVRLLGVDTPETKKPDTPVQPWGPEASDFTTRFVEGKTVRLVFDRERFDKYHRILAFVYVGDVCLNEELIRNGFSKAQLQYPYRIDMKRRFQAAETVARAHQVGLWSDPAQVAPPAESAPGSRKTTSPPTGATVPPTVPEDAEYRLQ